jgi:hypothetical protein
MRDTIPERISRRIPELMMAMAAAGWAFTLYVNPEIVYWPQYSVFSFMGGGLQKAIFVLFLGYTVGLLSPPTGRWRLFRCVVFLSGGVFWAMVSAAFFASGLLPYLPNITVNDVARSLNTAVTLYGTLGIGNLLLIWKAGRCKNF